MAFILTFASRNLLEKTQLSSIHFIQKLFQDFKITLFGRERRAENSAKKLEVNKSRKHEQVKVEQFGKAAVTARAEGGYGCLEVRENDAGAGESKFCLEVLIFIILRF